MTKRSERKEMGREKENLIDINHKDSKINKGGGKDLQQKC